ncbi:NAD(P)-binding protein [Blastococcus deserti]|uniref:NAD(P)-binding protein n=1 Tax=Blastococcus deserti TaxID=2259033 RepID=A0ABW4XF82_9ACTN
MTRIVIIGTGFGGLAAAVRLAEAGSKDGADDVVLFEESDDVGGVWRGARGRSSPDPLPVPPRGRTWPNLAGEACHGRGTQAAHTGRSLRLGKCRQSPHPCRHRIARLAVDEEVS